MKFEDFDGLGLADLVRKREVQPIELVDHAIERIESLNPRINAVVQKHYERARALAKNPLADAPFCGVPFLFKDLGAFDLGFPSGCGSRFAQDFHPRIQSEIVRRYLAAGFIPLGRTNTPEFGLLPTTEPKVHGPARNPWNLKHSTGGSSGGAAAAVAANMVPIAHAGDGGGSIRIPSSCCGVFGLKPSEGRSPIGPLGGRPWHGLVVEHVITRSVRDSAAALDAICAPESGAPIHAPEPQTPFLKQLDEPLTRLKIGLIEEPYFGSELNSDCRAAVRDAASLCESLAHTVEQTKFNIDAELVGHAYTVIVAAETRNFINNLAKLIGRKPRSRELELITHICSLGGNAFTASEYGDAVRITDEARRSIAATFENYDVVLTPTLAKPPAKIGELSPTIIERALMQFLKAFPIKSALRYAFKQIPKKSFQYTPYTFLFNTTGQPAMSVPLFWNTQGLPIGSQFVGEFGAEGLLLQLAKELEQARPFSRKPPIQAFPATHS